MPPLLPLGRSRTAWTIVWLGSLLLLWAGLSILAHQTTERAIWLTQWLFGFMIVITYVVLWGWIVCISQRPRLALLRGAMCTVVLVAILVSLELPALVGVVHWRLAFQRLSGDVQQFRWAFRHDRELGFRRRPHDHWVERPTSDIEEEWTLQPPLRDPIVFTYDRWGYRNPVDIEQADVVLIGDSYVEGSYVSDEDTAARRLEARLDRPIANLGVAGYGTRQEFLVLKSDGLRFQPKVVVWFFFEGNDLYDDHSFENFLLAAPPSPEETATRPEGLAYDQGWKMRSFSIALLERLRRWSAPVFPSNAPYFARLAVPGASGQTVFFADYNGLPWSAWMADRWERARGTLESVAHFSRAQGIDVLFVLVPTKFRVYRPYVNFDDGSSCRTWSIWPVAELFSEFCQSAGVPCLNLTVPFQEAVRDGGMPYAIMDSHWSPEGHDLVAELLATELRQRGWLSTGLAGR